MLCGPFAPFILELFLDNGLILSNANYHFNGGLFDVQFSIRLEFFLQEIGHRWQEIGEHRRNASIPLVLLDSIFWKWMFCKARALLCIRFKLISSVLCTISKYRAYESCILRYQNAKQDIFIWARLVLNFCTECCLQSCCTITLKSLSKVCGRLCPVGLCVVVLEK